MSIRDVLGDRLADELLRELESLRGELKRVIGEEIRPWAEFFGPISLPDWASGEAKKRIQVNASFFRANYTVFCMALWGLFLIFQPVFLVVLLGCGLLYFAVYLTRKQPLLLGDLSLGITGRLAVVSVMVFLLLAVTGYIFRLQWPISLGAVVCAGHAIFRPPVARALAAMNGKKNTAATDLEGGPVNDEQSLSAALNDPRNLPANANIRLRSRPLPPLSATVPTVAQPSPRLHVPPPPPPAPPSFSSLPPQTKKPVGHQHNT